MQVNPKLTKVREKIGPIKANLRYTRGIMPKRVTSGGSHLRGLAPRQQKNVAAVTSRYSVRFDRP